MNPFSHDIFTEPSDVNPDTLAITRGQVALASGQGKAGDDAHTLTATRGQTEYGICFTAFLEHGFRTDTYRIDISFEGDDAWSYDIRTMLTVQGRPEPFEHHDQNRLRRIGPAKPNPLKQILARRAETAIPQPWDRLYLGAGQGSDDHARASIITGDRRRCACLRTGLPGSRYPAS